MKDGDAVRIIAETEDEGTIGTLRGTAEVQIGPRAYAYRIVRFPDGHEGAYEEAELEIVMP